MSARASLGWPVIALTAGCLAVIGLGTATAATGNPLLLGHRNSEDRTTRLGSSAGIPLALHAPAGTAPLHVNSNTLVQHLNAARLAGHTAEGILTHARAGLLPAVEVAAARDGNEVVAPDGVKFDNVEGAAGDYTVSWTGMTGRAYAYCTGIRRPAAVANEFSSPDGSGSVRLMFDGIDTRFSCTIVSSTG